MKTDADIPVEIHDAYGFVMNTFFLNAPQAGGIIRFNQRYVRIVKVEQKSDGKFHITVAD
jgi:hypothetical protein